MNETGPAASMLRAFRWHWHLLGLGVAAGFGLLSGDIGLWWPIIAAGELAYLGFLGLNPRFQNVLRGQKQQAVRAQVPMQEKLRSITAFLSEEDLSRFQSLQQRCAGLLNLRRAMDQKAGPDGIDDFRGESLDRMLWLFLKLLHQKSGLQRFLATTHRGQIEFELKAAEEQVATAQKRDSDQGGVESRLTTSIKERITTIRERLANYDKAESSLELVSAEIDKTEQQITHLCEVGTTSYDGAGLSAQIDSISESLQTTGSAFEHASASSWLEADAAPPLLSGTAAYAQPPPVPARKSVRQ